MGRDRGWHRDYSLPARRNWATEEQKRVGWEIAVRIEKILCTVLHEAHRQQVEETMETLEEGPESFYRNNVDRD
ncbi:MAG: hypothetical protein AVDCRST_MAG93-724 [uncultured Chloroflexia bacterium]|uniref:Uncharacterized protein n=1 Tax=uncultured Chloroflexia bacterium TaxID=1672391 RepID=A0A6J4HKV5_9CHLR|nr:MAG: hypothetical protein AVDCRST_MAG93-724 [uncultured Chloroflexia bacterium]